jgi:hypothetical protein
MKRVAHEHRGTATRVYPACPALRGASRRVCALGSSVSRHHSPELEGAPPLVSKGGLLRSNATAPFLSPLGFLFHGSRFTSHESLTLEAHS